MMSGKSTRFQIFLSTPFLIETMPGIYFSLQNKIAKDRDKYHQEIVIRVMDKAESITSQVEA